MHIGLSVQPGGQPGVKPASAGCPQDPLYRGLRPLSPPGEGRLAWCEEGFSAWWAREHHVFPSWDHCAEVQRAGMGSTARPVGALDRPAPGRVVARLCGAAPCQCTRSPPGGDTQGCLDVLSPRTCSAGFMLVSSSCGGFVPTASSALALTSPTQG